MNISIICPIYNGEKFICKLDKSLMTQEGVESFDIRYVLTKSKDKSEEILRNIKANYSVLEVEEFSHSKTRENEAFKADGDIIVFITQDVIIEDNKWLLKLTRDIKAGVCDAAFSRQICENRTIERYTRMKNYPNESRIVSKRDIEKLGIMTYFYSDAAAAIRRSTFVELKGYDGKNLLTNEDMYISYKLIQNGYKIKYCADACVIHSHVYTYNSLFKRYFDQGVFLKQHKYISDSGAGSSALELVKFVAINSLKEKNFKAFFDIIPNFGVRFIANKLGARYEKLSRKRISKYTSNKNYWVKEEW
ncbi:glycosyltransferase [Clostridium vincentii]|uniref:N-glycosyltransferase n=1 Tax=Clostridium vincentii TaxID=52704 RepID=A0A2T0BGQ8_9CLOT|nr:glycosyltransferase [Clostridium vincentii]PRR83054.1 N-glycosyltransferase [Clostridium vincentii]